MMSPSNVELQRLLRLLADTATKAEQEAYAAGWRDCHGAMLKALGAVGDVPQAASNALYNPMPEMNGAASESAYAN
jgi:hypothetical protein